MEIEGVQSPDGEWTAFVPGFPELIGRGATETEAIERAATAVESWLGNMEAARAPRPRAKDRQKLAYEKLIAPLPHLLVAAMPSAWAPDTRWGATDRPDTPPTQRRALERVAATKRLLRTYRALIRLGHKYPDRAGLAVPGQLAAFVEYLGRRIFEHGDPFDNLRLVLGPGISGATPISERRHRHAVAVEVERLRIGGAKLEDAVGEVALRRKMGEGTVRNWYDARKRDAAIDAPGRKRRAPKEV